MKVKIFEENEKYLPLLERMAVQNDWEVVRTGNFDVLVTFLSEKSTANGFQIAEAIHTDRHVLALISEGISSEQFGIEQNRKLITIKQFNEGNVVRIVNEYLDHRKRGNLKRFNFVIPREQIQYLEWVAKRKGQSKSNFVRDLISKQLDQDKDYLDKKTDE